MPLPSARLLMLLALAAGVLAVAPAMGLAVDAALLVAALVDWRLARGTRPAVWVEVPRRLAHGEGGVARIEASQRGGRPVSLRIVLDVPAGLAAGGDDGGDVPVPVVVVPPQGRVRVEVPLIARARGRQAVSAVHLRWLGRLGLTWRQASEPLPAAVEVVPGLREMRAHRLLALRHHRWDPGLRRVRRRGEGTAFESLREYQRGDDPRHLDWKASARHGRPIVRQHEAERSQSVLLCLDAGRLMAEPLGRGDRLDHAAAAAVVLSEVARTWNDHVGLLAFSDRIERFLPPGRHPPDRIPALCADVSARPVEPDYPRVLTELARRLTRRTLIVVFGDVVDPAVSAPLAAHCARLARRHLLLFLALRNPRLFEVAHGGVGSGSASTPASGAYARAAAAELVLERAATLRAMRQGGIHVADVPPGGAVGEAVARYVEIKRRGVL